MRGIHLEPHLSTEELERHARQAQTRGAFQRFQALYLIQARHLSAPAVAEALQVSAAAVHQWVHLYNHGGVEGITLKGRGGRRRAYLTLEEEAALLEQLRARAGEGLLITAKAVQEPSANTLGPSGVRGLCLRRAAPAWLEEDRAPPDASRERPREARSV